MSQIWPLEVICILHLWTLTYQCYITHLLCDLMRAWTMERKWLHESPLEGSRARNIILFFSDYWKQSRKSLFQTVNRLLQVNAEIILPAFFKLTTNLSYTRFTFLTLWFFWFFLTAWFWHSQKGSHEEWHSHKFIYNLLWCFVPFCPTLINDSRHFRRSEH